MTDLPEEYDPSTVEPRLRERWLEEETYHHTGDPDYVIDTPPPYPTGNMHIGNALGWCYMDFLARYRRLQGDEVFFPQGWDCHGLPTEVKVEENHDIHRTEVPREEFRELCVEHTEGMIAQMRETINELGFSIDWGGEYRTMDPEYWSKTQRSFVEMYEDGLVYRDEHPVNWCPRCETAIADAEVETEEGVEGTLYYITFEGVGNDDIEIATTRPELLAACVSMAVSPDDDRYAGREGDTFEVPIFGQEVELVADENVDPEFGTGAVMICTFGDKQDVEWWAEYDLDLREVFTEDGHLGPMAGEFEGVPIDEAKGEIADALDDAGHLNGTEPTEQSVGVCWRCDTPIEILAKEQWFIEVDGDEVLERAQQVKWIPEHMYDRLEEWTEGMEWDWVISRQRVFATPIPAWFCGDCGHALVADADDLPADPTEEGPGRTCPECGSDDWEPETDVMDTWMDSSITPLYVAGWPDEAFEPTQLRPQGHDIIRTWAFYTLLRTAALAEEIPWETILINGMVFGDDGNKMSKSRGNFVQPEEVVEEYSADAFRQAMALGGQPGSDIQFQWKEVTAASRFITKLWNVSRFAAEHVDEDTPDVDAPAYRDADRWLLTRLDTTAGEVKELMDDYRFDAALRRLREFVWEDLADDYVELVKGRLYNGRPGERDAARHALYTALTAVLRMLSPFVPYVTEEIYSHLPGVEGSVHRSEWPAVGVHDEAAEARGTVIADVAGELRAWKSENGLPLNAELDRVEVYVEDLERLQTAGGGGAETVAIDTYDLSEAANAPIRVAEGTPDVELTPVGVDPDHSAIGPEFRERAGAIVAALEEADPAELKRQQRAGEIRVEVEGEIVSLDPGMVDVEEEYRAASGEEVAVLETEHATVIVFP
ncbi:MAG: valine--tRNA ligase [Halobacteriaceae archaeon]